MSTRPLALAGGRFASRAPWPIAPIVAFGGLASGMIGRGMAVHHDAYTFDPAAFHRALAEEVAVDGAVDERRLLAVAQRAVREASADQRVYLVAVANPPEDEGDEWWDGTGAGQLYVMAMAPYLRRAPALPPGALPPGRQRTLIEDHFWVGDRMETLVATADSALAGLAWRFEDDWYSFGGWLSVERATALLALLDRPPLPGSSAMVHGRISAIAEPIRAMLQCSIERDEALRAIWWC